MHANRSVIYLDCSKLEMLACIIPSMFMSPGIALLPKLVEPCYEASLLASLTAATEMSFAELK